MADTEKPASVAHIISGVQFSGPLPLPEILERYDHVIPGLAERIVSMAEKEQQQTHRLQREQMRYFSRGQWFAFALALIFVSIAGWLAFIGREAAACVIGGTTILGIVSIYITGKKETHTSKP